jgi:hypothetical protein
LVAFPQKESSFNFLMEIVPYMLAVHGISTGENVVDICSIGKAKAMLYAVIFAENVA